MKIEILLVFSVWLFSFQLSAQIPKPLGTGRTVELEALQTASGAFVAATMERLQTATSIEEYILIYRSTDLGRNWNQIDSIYGPRGSGDPVLAKDDNGVLYLIFMDIWLGSDLRIDLNLYTSHDDGLSWQYVSAPQFNNNLADYPQLLATGNGELFLAYSHFNLTANGLLEGNTVFKRSMDGGLNWLQTYTLPFKNGNSAGPDLCFLNSTSLMLSVGNTDASEIYVLYSADKGLSWSAVDTLKHTDTTNVFNITKPKTSKRHLGVLAHQPHQLNSPLTYYFNDSIGSNWQSNTFAEGAYAESLIDSSGAIHVIYNRQNGNRFELNYILSTNGGLYFSAPIVLYSASFETTALGEYQSFIKGMDGQFYVTFCDWSDASKAKMLVFGEDVSKTESTPLKNAFIFPNPGRCNFTIDVDAYLEVSKIVVTDQKGRTIKNIQVQNNPNITFDLPNVGAGNYLVQIHTENTIIVQRLVKL
jgi:hypothetical protein